MPLGRRAECPVCHAELHVCRMCRHYDVAKAKECREPVAEPVREKTRANFCDWFQLAADASPAQPVGDAGGRAALEALFGDAPGAPANPDGRRALDDLFKS